MAKFLGVRGSKIANRLMGRSGLRIPCSDSAPRRFADSVVSNMGAGASEYQKDVIWQWAYNEAMAGRQSNIPHITFGRLDAASAYTDLITGTVSPDTGTGTVVAQDGIQLASEESLQIASGLLSRYSNAEDFAIFLVVSAQADVGSYHEMAANLSGSGQNSAQITADNGGVGGVFNGIPTAVPGSTQSQWLNKVIFLMPNADKSAGRIIYGDVDQSVGTTFDQTSFRDLMVVNTGEAGQAGTMTFVAGGVVDSDIDFGAFASNLEAALDALTRTQPAFSNYLADGDSINVSGLSQWVGFEEVMENQTTSNRSFSESGRLLQTIASELSANIAANPIDDMLIGGGGNDVNAPEFDTYPEMQSYVDSVFSTFVAQRDAGNVKTMIFKTITPFKGNLFPGLWNASVQTVLEQTNLYIKQKVAETEGAYLADFYPVYESPYVADTLKGLYYIDNDFSQVSYTDTRDPAYSHDGIHTTNLGALAGASIVDGVIDSIRYYKGGRA